jgi:hypothetical protein
MVHVMMAGLGPVVFGLITAAVMYGMSTPTRVSEMSRRQWKYVRRLPGHKPPDLEALIRQNRLILRSSAVIWLIFTLVAVLNTIWQVSQGTTQP